MSQLTDEQWEQSIAQAKQKLRVDTTRVPPRSSNRKLNLGLFLVPLLALVSGLVWPQHMENLMLVVVVLGGLGAFGVLAVYATSRSVSHVAKEAALNFLFGDLIVFGLILLKPV